MPWRQTPLGSMLSFLRVSAPWSTASLSSPANMTTIAVLSSPPVPTAQTSALATHPAHVDSVRCLAKRVAVVTGAASGLGRALSHELAGRGCRLALVDMEISATGMDTSLCAVQQSHTDDPQLPRN